MSKETAARIRYPIRNRANRTALKQGLKSGIPIGLGYFAVAFSLGIVARNAGLNAVQSTVVSLFCNASAGEYAGFAVIAAAGSFLEMALITLIANARYLLMSSAMSQRIIPGISFGHRMLMGLYVTDEIFGVSMSRPGYLNPWFTYGCAIIASPLWALGTGLGCIAGDILPLRVVSALSVALFGMFLATIIPPAKSDKIIALIIVICFALSSAAAYIPGISSLPEGIRIIILTVAIAAAAALLFPRNEEGEA
ncbi:MAG: AzlC family ABC transporter permease [Lachnospiraceae bacterium]|jgi:predicted branched-subunit amino acid permease